MKRLLTASLLTAISCLPFAHGAAFISDFTGLNPGAPGDPLDGYDGWAQSEANPGADPLAWGLTVGVANGFGLGVAFGAPSADPFYAYHSVGIGLAGTHLQTTFVITDSTSEWPDRNDYSIGIYDGTNLLFSLDMLAINQDVPGGTNDQWNVRWTTGNDSSAAFGGVLEDGLYTLSVMFTGNGSDVDFALALTGANTYYVNNTLTGLASANITEYRVTTTIGSGSDWGDGFIGITGIAVPEPSSLALLGLGALGLSRRRRAN